MNSQTSWTVSIVALAALLGGCFTVVKEGVGVARGAKGTVTVRQAIAADEQARPLGVYERFELRITDATDGKTPAQLLARLPEEFSKQLTGKKIPNARSGKTLLINAEILHYEDSSAVGLALGPLEFVVAKVEFVDESSKRRIGLANCVGRTTERVNLGVAKKAEGLAKAIVNWIDENYPQDKRVE